MAFEKSDLLRQISAGVAISAGIGALAYWVFLLGYFYKKAYWAAFNAQDFYLFEASEGALRLTGGFTSLLSVILGFMYLLILSATLITLLAVSFSTINLIRRKLKGSRKGKAKENDKDFEWEKLGRPKPLQYLAAATSVLLFTQIIADTTGKVFGKQDYEKLRAAKWSQIEDLPPVRRIVLKTGDHAQPARILSCGENFCGVWNGASIDILSKDNFLSITPYVGSKSKE